MAVGLTRNRRTHDTWGERVTNALLRATGLSIEANVQIGRWNVDVLVEGSCIVECFGDYWHCNPAMWEPEEYNRSLRCTAAEKWRKDLERCRALFERGYSVFILWEKDLRQGSSTVRRTLRKVIDEVHRRHHGLR